MEGTHSHVPPIGVFCPPPSPETGNARAAVPSWDRRVRLESAHAEHSPPPPGIFFLLEAVVKDVDHLRQRFDKDLKEYMNDSPP